MGKGVKLQFIVLVIICLILIGIGNTGVAPKFQLRVASIFTPLSEWASFLFNEFKIRHENKVLRTKLAELSLRNQMLTSLQYENEELRKLLEFKARESHKLIAARVVGREPGPISGICIVDKGLADGVEENLPVVTINGIYGKVIEVMKEKALVQTIFNFNFRVAAVDLRSGVQGIVRWDEEKGYVLEQVAVNSDVEVGDEIITSGIGSVFPKGMRIEKVKEKNVDKTRLFYEVSLEPACKFSEVEGVFIVKPESIGVGEKLIPETPAWRIYMEAREEETKEEVKKIKKTELPSLPGREEEEFPIEFQVPEPIIRAPE